MKLTVRSRPAVVKLPPPEFPEVTDPRKRAWLVAFAVTGKLVEAAAAAQVSIRTAFNWRRDVSDREFQAALVVAVALQGDFCEAEVKRRAYEGVDEPIYQGGRLVGTRVRYSDNLAMFYLKGMMPEKYREHVEHSGPKGGAIPIAHSGRVVIELPDNARSRA